MFGDPIFIVLASLSLTVIIGQVSIKGYCNKFPVFQRLSFFFSLTQFLICDWDQLPNQYIDPFLCCLEDNLTEA